MKKQIKKIGLLFSLVLAIFVSFGLANVKATDNKTLNVSRAVYNAVINSESLTDAEKNTIKSQSDETTHKLVISTELINKIKELRIAGERKENISLSELNQFVNLEKLTIVMGGDGQFKRGDYVSIVDFTPVVSCTKLKSLQLSLVSIKESDLSVLGNLNSLESFLFDGEISGNLDFSKLKNLKSLKQLTVNANNISNISEIGNLTNLEELNLYNFYYSNSGTLIDLDLSTIKSLKALKKLSLSYFNISNFTEISSLTNLEEIDIYSFGENKALDFTALKNMKAMKKIHMGSGNKSIVSNISQISNLTNLEELSIAYGIGINDNIDFSIFKNMKMLKTLNLNLSNYDNGTSISNFSQISNLTNLVTLYLNNLTGVKDLDFSAFKNMKKLESVHLEGFSKSEDKINISNFSEISNVSTLKSLYLTSFKGIENVKVIEQIEKLGYQYHFAGCDLKETVEGNEYVLPKLIGDSDYYSKQLEITGGKLSDDHKKVIFTNTPKAGDKITINCKYIDRFYNSTITVTYQPHVYTYGYVEGKSQTYTMNSGKGATFRIDADYSLFKNGGKVFVDNKEVASKYITSKEGSTIITLAEEFLKTLKAGQHEIKVVFSNGVESKAGFVVAEQKTETKTETNTNVNTNTTTTTSGTSTTNTNTTKPTDYKSNPDTGRIVISYADLSVVNAINF